MDIGQIRNFCIIAHIDHGKSTLADRFLEITGTIEKRKMKEQVLDSMELERERGITIKMQPVRMNYTLNATAYTLNLIDTPGHIDFYYEVSRALKAVEGAVLLVDATQGVQAQTISTLAMAREAGIVIVPAVSKIDSPLARIIEVKKEIAVILSVSPDEILEVSGRTGEGVDELLREVVSRVPPPHEELPGKGPRALVFDFQYSNHTGVIVYVRVIDGSIEKGEKLRLAVGKQSFLPIEFGIFTPEEIPKNELYAGEIGYITTGIKEPGIASVGDTVTSNTKPLPVLPGYQLPKPVVFASLYPEAEGAGSGRQGGDDFTLLRQGLSRLRLSDSSFTYEEEASGLLGRGFRCGFLGMLHLEIITERLRREFSLALIVTTPSVTYEVVDRRGKRRVIYSPIHFPEYGDIVEVYEPWVSAKIITPGEYVGPLMKLLYEHEVDIGVTETFGDLRVAIAIELPLRELMRNFFDELKSVTSGFASLSYALGDIRKADVVKLDILVAEEIVPAFSRVVSRRKVEEEAQKAVDKLYTILPKQLFATKIQAVALGRIISSRTLSALRKDVTGYLYGGDITRKMKLWKKQKEGKKRLKDRGTVNIPHEVFLKMMRKD